MPNKIDIYDENNQPTGKQSSITHAVQNNLWRRGVLVIVATETGYVLIQKRSAKIIGHPNYLDMSCGGFVDMGEKPLVAAQRECSEELGLKINTDQLVAIKPKPQSSWPWPLKDNNRHSFLYRYLVLLPDHTVDVSNVQADEVAWAKFVPFKKAKQLARLHRILGLGKLKPVHKLHRQNLKFAEKAMKQTKLSKNTKTTSEISIIS